jgi:hypothetical protein
MQNANLKAWCFRRYLSFNCVLLFGFVDPSSAGWPFMIHRLSRCLRNWCFRCRDSGRFVNSSWMRFGMASFCLRKEISSRSNPGQYPIQPPPGLMLDASGMMVIEFAVAIRELGSGVVIARLAFPAIMRFRASLWV